MSDKPVYWKPLGGGAMHIVPPREEAQIYNRHTENVVPVLLRTELKTSVEIFMGPHAIVIVRGGDEGLTIEYPSVPAGVEVDLGPPPSRRPKVRH